MATNLQEPKFSTESSSVFCGHMGRNGAELTTCFACGDRFCSICSQCACDRLAAYLNDLHQAEKKESRLSLLQRFIQEWAE
jgi:hypothetical protein